MPQDPGQRHPGGVGLVLLRPRSLMHLDPARAHRPISGGLAFAVLLLGALVTAGVRAAPLEGDPAPLASVDHVVISEVMTGGTSASDEFVELYNPGSTARSLDGLELVYVTATGATVTRKAVWDPGAQIAGRSHLLVANEAGIFAGVADLTYANGLAATGGSMALRGVAASTAVDAVGWGNATGTWHEGTVASAPSAGSSLERLPGGSQGSGQDSDQNAVDFIVRGAPDPRNAASLPVP
ncbi:MAG TPA: lamin tail domain-containing protein, partial [Candidatus Limnocylindria bacterium]|nr:lamin tail domain-containing protein [Candidatus Limnocylindria bacterium]